MTSWRQLKHLGLWPFHKIILGLGERTEGEREEHCLRASKQYLCCYRQDEEVLRASSLCARLYCCLCFLKQRSWGQGARPDSSLSALLQVRTSARGRSTACGPPMSAHGKPGWTLCHTLTKVTFTSRLLKGHSMTPGAGEEEEGEGSFIPFFFFFKFVTTTWKKYTLSLLLYCPLSRPALAPSLPKCYSISSPFISFNSWLVDFLLSLHFILSAEL